MMKVIIPEKRLEKLLLDYLDFKFGDLEKTKGGYFDYVFKFPDEHYGIIGYREYTELLFVYDEVINEIKLVFPIRNHDIEKNIFIYFEQKFNMSIKGIRITHAQHFMT
jgi:hypothetical protein